jgi:transposase
MPSVVREKELNDRLWARVRPLLPAHPASPKGGRPRADDRACFEAVVYVLRNGLRWRDLPAKFPSPATCWRRHAEWSGDGVWEDVWRAVLDELAEAGLLDASELYLDCTFAPAQKGGRASGIPSAARG